MNEAGLFEVEYADILGIPFDFTAQPTLAKPVKPRQTVLVQAMCPERNPLEIVFPRVAGYRTELPETQLEAKFTPDSVLELNPNLVGPSRTLIQGIVGEGTEINLEHLEGTRKNTIIYHLWVEWVLGQTNSPWMRSESPCNIPG